MNISVYIGIWEMLPPSVKRLKDLGLNSYGQIPLFVQTVWPILTGTCSVIEIKIICLEHKNIQKYKI